MELVLFDIDGTLIQTGGAGVKAFSRAFETAFGLDRATIGLQFAGRTDTGLAREIFIRNGIAPGPENFRLFFDSYVFWLDSFLRELNGRVCPGVMEFISGWTVSPHPPVLGLLTGNIRLGAEIKLRHFGLWDFFRVGAFADDHEDRNQISVMAHRRCSTMLGRNLPGDEILVVGDTPLDIECARAIGAKALAVATGGFSLDQLKNHRPDWAVKSLEELTPSQIRSEIGELTGTLTSGQRAPPER